MAKRSSLGALVGALAWGAAILGILGAGAAGVSACSAAGRASATGTTASGTGGSGGASSAASGAGGEGGETSITGTGGDGPPPLDAGGLCGNQIHQVITDPPNLYFVFDVSGSMGDPAMGGFTKYELVEHSAVEMIENLGPLINFGAALFPTQAGDGCQAGAEVFPMSPGDPISPMTGPSTEGFIVATSVTPGGGTPTAATLTALLPGLQQIKGRTVVILSTDGGPNCNAALTCDVTTCVNAIEDDCMPPGSNCCGAGDSPGPEGCLDSDAAVAAVGALAAAAIPVFVIGVPGSTPYATVLDDMAKAGGEPQASEPYYYDVDNLGALSGIFQGIAANLISCDFVLQDPPPDELHTNVYFDGVVVPADPANGWVWKSPDEIELVGTSCTALKNGMVAQVQIVSGCPTDTK